MPQNFTDYMADHLFPTPKDREERHGQYHELVEKFSETLRADIADGSIVHESELDIEIDDIVERTITPHDRQGLAIQVLMWSENCHTAFEYDRAPHWLRDCFEVQNDAAGRPFLKGPPFGRGDEFPFDQFAKVVLARDIRERVEGMNEYRGLTKKDD